MNNTETAQTFKVEELIHVDVYPKSYPEWDSISDNGGDSVATRILTEFNKMHAPDLDGPTTGSDRQAFNVLLLRKDLPEFEALVNRFNGLVLEAGPVEPGYYGDSHWGMIGLQETETPGILAWIE